jgi:hypothetical protein
MNSGKRRNGADRAVGSNPAGVSYSKGSNCNAFGRRNRGGGEGECDGAGELFVGVAPFAVGRLCA